MTARQPEAKVVAAVLKYLNGQPRTVAFKVNPGPYQRAGEPDIDAVSRGRAVKLEVKRPGTEAAVRKAVTPLQRRRLLAYLDAGAVAAVVTSVDEVAALLGHPLDPALRDERQLIIDRVRARLQDAP